MLDYSNVDDLVFTINSTRIVSYINAGCIAILFYDCFDCFEKEVNTIWKKKWTMTKFMYILTRYSAVLEGGIVMYQLSIPGDWYDDCSFAFKLNAWMFVFGLGVGEVIMTIRTWAVWQKNRFLMFALPIFYVVVWAAGFATTALFLQSLEFKPNPLTPYVGCYATYTDPIIFISWVLLLFYDAGAQLVIMLQLPSYRKIF
ncbi:hypothetical protein JR316_0006365 [Psilocybe cubensis]|uniref:Uncharacterized protein n=1 Tax=Psilocybe cubensis TaxID=181762 RepID=A0ACB8H3R2_PSICU|nr:hypothetical protein JR316_0006365 [Psilocybe cubensis]KAH9481835.1 hypothetical protein JR316_0006365 [Psilocybe cubensis]